METLLGLVVFAVIGYFIYKQWNKDDQSNESTEIVDNSGGDSNNDSSNNGS